MSPKKTFSYRSLQLIKSEEYYRFFSQYPEYQLYLNHLGELHWMTEEEAENQHEFFIYTPGPLARLKQKLHFRSLPSWNKLSPPERELRLQFRQYLEKKYLGQVQPQTERLLPDHWEHPLTEEDIEGIPITLDIIESSGWRKPVILAGVFLLLILAVGLYFSLGFNQKELTGKIKIYSNVKSASIFLDDTKIGYSDSVKIISNIPIGNYRLSLEKPGFDCTPPFHEIEVFPDSVVEVNFFLSPVASTDMGYVQITTDFPDSRIFIDNNYLGRVEEQPLYPLSTGTHRVTVKKSGYITSPAEEIVTIYPGDTTLVIFHQVRATTQGPGKGDGKIRVQNGTLEVTANTSGARIYLNEMDTGKEADYVFTNLAPGTYHVKLVKEGYRSVPEEQVITITQQNPSAEVGFELIKEYEDVRIITQPVDGQIFIDGKLVGKGKYVGKLKVGEHTVSFGDLPDYNTPNSQRISVQPNMPVNITVQYFPNIQILAEVTRDGNIRTQACEVSFGYTFSDRGFSPSNEAGPDIVFHEKLNDYYWKFGFAFPFRNPKGNDALKLTFTMPQDLNFQQKFTLKIFAAASKENYPLTISGKVDIKIRFNGKILSYYYKPRFLEELNGMEESRWDISSYIRPGVNSLEISTTDKNNTFYYLKRIVIFN
ncbi:MAG: PEGA domain-containing protein [Calditrichaeota bacterium]|nr:MAG: PEGA domain-containing protein [Calditrichota bacterium]